MTEGRTSRIGLVLRFSIVFLLLSLPSGALPQEASISMATEAWPPFRMNDPQSPSGFRGIDIDITNALSKAIGITIKIERHPWARALESMRTGQTDMITGVAYTSERETYMYYVPVSYYTVRPVFYTQKGKGRLFATYEDLRGPSVGYSLNSAYFEPFNSDRRINKVGLSTEEQLLHAPALRRIDITIGTDPNISFDIARLGYRDRLEPTRYQPPDKTDLFIALSRKSTAMAYAPDIKRALQKLLREGTVQAILDSYR